MPTLLKNVFRESQTVGEKFIFDGNLLALSIYVIKKLIRKRLLNYTCVNAAPTDN